MALTPVAADPVATACEPLIRRMRDLILPFWASEGVDRDSDLFWERLDLSGRPIRRVPFRFMVQARQVATFLDAARRGGGDPEPILRLFDRVLAAYSEGGDLSAGLAFSIDRDGTVVDPTRDAYSHAFGLFALAAAIRTTGERRYRDATARLLAFIDGALADETGGLKSRWPDAPPGRAQNPTMHLLEAYLALHDAWPERDFLDRAERLVGLAETRLIAPAEGVILEHYSEHWRPLLERPDGCFFEPGHQFEWVWLLARYAAVAGRPERPVVARLWRAATTRGRDDEGFCLDEVGLGARPSQRTRRLWPHTEGLRAAVIRPPEAAPDRLAVLTAMVEALDRSFLGRPFPAGWIDRLDEEGAPAVDVVPASSLYHLYGALVGIEDGLERASLVQAAKEDACRA